jgi:2-polyprenyl-3-methyl-5-hydroxy-6-metoxy-1,4-benzoquinol methylase
MRTDPRPTPLAMSQYYPADYGPHASPVNLSYAASSYRPVWKRLASAARHQLISRVFHFNTEAVPDMPPGRMLEVGCSTGVFLSSMAERGWSVEGLEPCGRAARLARARGLRVEAATLESVTEARGPYDLVVGWMVLEHLHDPGGGLLKLRRWTRPKGWLALSVPNAAALEFKVFGDAWYALQLPTHLYHFTPKALRLLLERTGWRLRRLVHQRTLSNLLASAGYWLQDRDRCPRLSTILQQYPTAAGAWAYRLYPLACALALLGQTGRMTVWAQNRDD